MFIVIYLKNLCKMDLNIIYEDESILVLDKPYGLVVNRAQTIKLKTLQDLLCDYFKLGESLGIGDRAGIVHRLDRETSGVLVVAKSEAGFVNLQAQFKSRKVKKEYTALVHGVVREEKGIIENKIGRVGKFGKFGIVNDGREATTKFEILKKLEIDDEVINMFLEANNKARKKYLKNHAKFYSLLRVLPATGRTHQIRVQLKFYGNPVVSDSIYGPTKLYKIDVSWCPRLFLHAAKIEFVHPTTRRKIMFEATLPGDLRTVLESLKELG